MNNELIDKKASGDENSSLFESQASKYMKKKFERRRRNSYNEP